jgi:lysophospholipase L1-like esterase
VELRTTAAGLPEAPIAPIPRRELLEARHLTVPSLAATMAVFLSTDRDGRVRRGAVAARLSGVTRMRAQSGSHAAYWRQTAAEAEATTGPLWLVLGDSAAQAIGATDPADGYVGRVRAALSRRDGVPWRVINLSTAGALTADVITEQLPRLHAMPAVPQLVSCNAGANDVLRTAPRRLRSQLGEVAARLPTGSVLLTLTAGLRGVGRTYLGWLNAGIRAAAERHGHRVADVDRHYAPPWRGKFSPDGFHPSARGYADWANAVLAALEISPDQPGPRDAGSQTPGSQPLGRRTQVSGPIG